MDFEDFLDLISIMSDKVSNKFAKREILLKNKMLIINQMSCESLISPFQRIYREFSQ